MAVTSCSVGFLSLPTIGGPGPARNYPAGQVRPCGAARVAGPAALRDRPVRLVPPVRRLGVSGLRDGVPLLGHADFGQADEVDELAEAGQAAERGGRGACLRDLPEYAPHGGGRRE